jgi:two-component SAPR family response regulator
VKLESQDTKKRIEILTLGCFDIRMEQESLLESSFRSYKVLELLKFFITFRNKKHLPEAIMEALLPESNFKHPKNVIRTQIYRLRKILKNISSIAGDESCFNIVFSNGQYGFITGQNCALDVDIFEKLISLADQLREINPLKAIEYYKSATSLYQGEYMVESQNNQWLIPIRNYYHGLYLRSLFRLLELLKQNSMYAEIINVYKNAIMLQPFEETLHIYFIEALMMLGEFKHALGHYNYITSKLYREPDAKPSSAMRDIYRRLQDKSEDRGERDLSFIERQLVDSDEVNGALCCDMDYFKFVYNLERRKNCNQHSSSFLGIVTIVPSRPLTEEQKLLLKHLKECLAESLEVWDVFSPWNDSQVVIITNQRTSDSINSVIKNLKSNFYKKLENPQVKLEIEFRPVKGHFPFFPSIR